MNKDYKILFVCLGNICRSPAAEEVMRQLVCKAGLEDRIRIDSAGTYGGHAGNKSDPRMRHAAEMRGYHITHRSRQITFDDFGKHDLIVVMDDSNYDNVRRLAPDTASVRKIHRMSEFFRNTPYDHVPDPYYEGAEGFELVLDLLEDSCAELLETIRKEQI